MKAFLVSTALLAALCFSAPQPKKTIPTATPPQKGGAATLTWPPHVPPGNIFVRDKLVKHVSMRIDGLCQFNLLGQDTTALYAFYTSAAGGEGMLSVLLAAKETDTPVTVIHDTTSTIEGHIAVQYLSMQ